jgi:NADPH:quinone reductase-like Zn-dependent oxidoreductase
MLTYRIESFTGPDGLVMLEEDVPQPGQGQVLVRIRATSLNYRDLVILEGSYPLPGGEGRVPLSDAAGEVVAVGEGVTRFQVGDRVMSSFSPSWLGGELRLLGPQRDYYMTGRDGWLTEMKVEDASALVAIPKELTFEAAATLPCAAVTAWNALAGVTAGDTVLTQGSGGVSLFALQLAKAKGARVLATTSSDVKAARLRELGADVTLNYAANPDWSEEVLAATQGRGVDRVVDVGGPSTLAQSLKAVVYAGQVALVGALSFEGAPLDFLSIFLRQATLRPIPVGSRTDLEAAVRAFAQHQIHPVIDRVFPLTEAKEALRYYAGRGTFGKVVLQH